MVAAWCCTARIFLSNTSVRKSLCLVRRWWPAIYPKNGPQSMFQCRTPAKITLICWGTTGGLACGVRCEGVADKGIQINVDVHINKGRPSNPCRTWSSFSLVLRACVLLLKFGPLFWFYPLTYLSSGFKSLWLHLLLKVTESSGPTCIKLGQWASTRRDLFSEEFCTKFSKLHIRVDPHPWDYTRCSLQKAIGEGWEKVFTFESQEPVGSGCVAQVYKAYVDISAVEKPVLNELSRKSMLEAWQVSGLKGLFKRFWEKKHEEVTKGNGSSQSCGFQKGVNQDPDSGEQTPVNATVPSSSPKRDHLLPVAIKVRICLYEHNPNHVYSKVNLVVFRKACLELQPMNKRVITLAKKDSETNPTIQSNYRSM